VHTAAGSALPRAQTVDHPLIPVSAAAGTDTSAPAVPSAPVDLPQDPQAAAAAILKSAPAAPVEESGVELDPLSAMLAEEGQAAPTAAAPAVVCLMYPMCMCAQL
jgi:hypothetical protein